MTTNAATPLAPQLPRLVAAALILMIHVPSWAQSDSARPVVIEAEAGTLGAEFSVVEEDTLTYISIQTDFSSRPQRAARVATYQVTFPAPGSYSLYARVRVGPDQFDDDSFFIGRGFGEKNPIATFEWLGVNGLSTGGFTEPGDYVSGAGGAGHGVWKWIDLNAFGADTTMFVVEDGELTKTLQIGGREDGLEIDRMAFGRSDLYFQVDDLDQGQAGTSEPPSRERPTGPMAEGLDKFLGNIYSTSQRLDFTDYWNQVTPENAGKWGSVERQRDVMDWSELDKAYDLAKSNGFPYRHHVLVWGNQQPAWIEQLPADEQLEEIEEWFAAVASRYPDVDFVEVVNEPLHDPPTDGSGNYYEALGGAGETGWDWIITAFRMAREHFPEARLMINEYSILNSASNVERYLEIIELLQAEGLIDGIGAQGHAFSTRAPASTLTSNLDRLATTGLPIQITELDVDGLTDGQQLETYRRIFPALWEHPAVEGITLWGWRPGMWRSGQGAYLVTSNGAVRPAFQWMQDYMAAQRATVAAERTDLTAAGSVRVVNHPNPFRESTFIRYEVERPSYVTLQVFDSIGRRVAKLIDRRVDGGEHVVSFEAGDLANGVYVCRLQVGDTVHSRLMVLAR